MIISIEYFELLDRISLEVDINYYAITFIYEYLYFKEVWSS